MRLKLLALSLLAFVFAGSAIAAVIVEKRSRQLPSPTVFDCAGVHAFIFRGPTGTSRRPILVPPREYWTEQESGLYGFVLRYHSGNVRSRMVTPEVFARYRVGDDFRDSDLSPRENYESNESKDVQPMVRHHRHRTAQLRQKHKQSASHRLAAKHRRHHASKRIAAR